jgi:hypothetical protein
MHLSSLQLRLLGSWSGESRLFTPWMPNPESASNSTLVVSPAAKGNFLSFAYTWSHEGVDHEGLLLVGNANKAEEATAAWIDSWHMSGSVMQCKGSVDEPGVILLRGSYAVPPGPDWGWRIEVRSPSADELALLMFNISPEGGEDIAVQADYKRS